MWVLTHGPPPSLQPTPAWRKHSHLKPHFSTSSCPAQVNPIKIVFCYAQVYEWCFTVVSCRRTWACLILNLSKIPVNLKCKYFSLRVNVPGCFSGVWEQAANPPLWYPLKWCNQAETSLSWKMPLAQEKQVPACASNALRWDISQRDGSTSSAGLIQTSLMV